MLTNNFKNIFKSFLTLGYIYNSTSTTKQDSSKYPIKDTNGSTYYYNSGGSTENEFPHRKYVGLISSINSDGIILGSGTTPPSATDYSLDSIITSCSASAIYVTSGDDNGDNYIRFDIILKNNGSSSVTISEIGWINRVSAYDSSSGGSYTNTRRCLMDRTLLDTPITIEAGEMGVVTYNIKLEIV